MEQQAHCWLVTRVAQRDVRALQSTMSPLSDEQGTIGEAKVFDAQEQAQPPDGTVSMLSNEVQPSLKGRL